MTNRDLELELADVLDELATVNKFLAKLSPSLTAVLHALEEVSPDRFAEAYERNLSAPIPVQVRKELNLAASKLQDRAKQLRNA